MAFHTVLLPPPGKYPGGERGALERAELLRDGFQFYAFFFTGVWLLTKKLWLAFTIFILLWAVLLFGAPRLGLPPIAVGAAQFLIALFLGLEGNALIERKLMRKGWRLAGVVEGKDLDHVRRRFLESTLAPPAPAPPPAPLPAAAAMPPGYAAAAPGVLGLFPDARGR